MSLSSNNNLVRYLGNATTATFSFPFKVFQASDLQVYELVVATGVQTLLNLNTDYTVSGVGVTTGGSITLTAGALPVGTSLVIQRQRPLVQSTDLRNQGTYYPETIEDTFDQLVMNDQQVQRQINSALQLPPTIDPTQFSPILPTLTQPGASLIVSSTGTSYAMGPTAAQLAAGIAAGTQAVSSAAAAATSQGAAAVSATNAATSASQSSGYATASANSATSSQNSATSAQSLAGQASTSATNAAQSATSANTSAQNAASSQTSASTSASNASTSATNASNSATAAANSATQAQASAQVIPTGGTAGQVLVKNSSTNYDTGWQTNQAGITQLTGDVTTAAGSGSQAATIANLARTKLATGTAGANVYNDASGNLANEAQVAKVRGGTGQDNSNLTFPSTGTIPTLPAAGFVKSSGTALTSQTAITLGTDTTGVLAASNGGTGVNSTATYPASGTVAVTPPTGFVTSNGTALSSKAAIVLTSDVSGALPVANGGTGSTTLPNSGFVTSTGTALSSQASISLTSNVSGTLPIANGGTNLTAAPSAGFVTSNGTAYSSKAAVVLTSDVSGLLPSANGGTGVNSTATYPASGTIPTVPAAGVVSSSGTALTSKSAWSLTTDVSGVLPIANGGTNLSSAPTAGFLISNGSAYSSKAAVVLTSDVSGLLPTANGGTGQNSTATFPTTGTVATTSNAETFSNKTLTQPIIDVENLTDQSATPATPASGVTKVYTRAGQLYKLANDGLETLVGSGSSSGAFNYLTNGSYESGIATANLAKTTVTSNLPTGTVNNAPGSSTLTLSVNTSGALRGTKCLQVAGVNWAQGDGVAVGPAFTVNPEDFGKVLTYSLAYQVTSGASLLNFSGVLGSQNMALAVYDVTNALWLPLPAGALGINSSSVPGIVSCTFQSSVASGQQYQAYLFNLGAAVSGSTTVLLDDVVIGPTKVVNGAAVSDWISFTPTGSWTTNVTYTGKYKRIGDTAHIQYNVACTGAPNSANLTLNMPSGLTMDTTKLAQSARASLGTGIAFNGSGAFILEVDGTGSGFEALYQSSTAGGASGVSISAPFTVASGNYFTFTVQTPVVGWSSNVQMSSDTDTRVISFTGATSSVAVTGGSQDIPATASQDKAGAWNGSAFKVPVTGDYVMVVAGVNNAANAYFVPYYNGNAQSNTYGSYAATAGTAQNGTFFFPNCKPNDALSFRTSVSGTVSANVNIYRLSGPSVIAATESVYAAYNSGAAQSIPNTTATTIVYGNKVRDTHAAMNATTGIYTCPVSGPYEVTGAASFSGNATGSSRYVLAAQTGSASVSYIGSPRPPTTGVDNICTVTAQFSCVAGDQIRINGYQDSGGALALTGNIIESYFFIKRIGN